MLTTVKIFKTGNSQAVRLPKAFRFDSTEVWLHKDELTGVLTVTPKPTHSDLDVLFQLIADAEVPEAFMCQRDNGHGEFRDIF
ncbi:MAG: AbrB/MazE/SpoVT family DNA-binding domain-containing protein [Methylococcaceae bacterium]|nr:AbrB/MazE/SpoVT family DNA-binding domain-containing protein [Methylococcaceae bacterium]